MDHQTLISARCSVRKFEPEHIRQSDLDIIVHAGQIAPTAADLQPQRILVINNDEEAAKLKECRASQSHAPSAR